MKVRDKNLAHILQQLCMWFLARVRFLASSKNFTQAFGGFAGAIFIRHVQHESNAGIANDVRVFGGPK